MKVAVVGAGISGLGAALRLREKGHEVTVYDRASQAGGRCASIHWWGDWHITGAFAFITSEDNLIAQAKSLGSHRHLLDMINESRP